MSKYDDGKKICILNRVNAILYISLPTEVF